MIHRSRTSRPVGILAMEAVIGLMIVAMLAGLFAVALTQHRKAAQRLTDTRYATRLAEQTLTAMQTGQPLPQPPDGVKLECARLPEPGDLPAGCAWAGVRVISGDRSVQLVGIVRADALKEAAP